MSEQKQTPTMVSPDGLLSRKALRTSDPPISWMLEKALTVPQMISLAAGFVDQESLPCEKTAELVQEILRESATQKACLQYGCTEGHLPLRQSIVDYFASSNGVRSQDCSISAHDVIVTTGSQQLLYLLADVLLNEGDIILVEDPTYFVFLSVLEAVGARVMGIPTGDEGGIQVDALRAKLEHLERTGDIKRLKAFYVMTYYMNPKGTCFAREKHQELLKLVEEYWAKGYPFYVIEDAAYRELSYDCEPFPCIKTLDTENRYVVYTNSFSKAYAPGIRTGYGIFPQSLGVHVARQKGNLDFGSPTLAQYILHKALALGKYQEHSAFLRQMYGRKRDIALESIDRHFPPGLKIVRPRGGLYVWVQLPQGCETGPDSVLFEQALKNKVIYVPGQFCYAQEPDVLKDRCSMRLCYAYISIDELREGVRRMGESIAAVLGT